MKIAMSAIFALLLAGLMIDVEFFRYFGDHVSSIHLHFLSDWDYIYSSLFSFSTPSILALQLLIFPAAFVFVVLRSKPRWLDSIAQNPKSLYGCFAIMAVGAGASYVSMQTILVSNLVENCGIAVVRGLLWDDGIKGDHSASIEEILDTLPLPNGGGETLPWIYPDPAFPLLKATLHQLCKVGKQPADVCSRDGDNDGYTLVEDCNDLDPNIHPDAFDIPRNGVDEDCSGCDAEPPNVIYIHWEGLRSVNVDSVGYSTPSTPWFYDLATNNGMLFTNAYANATQTRWSLMSVYCSLLPRLSTEWIFEHNPDLNLQSFPSILRKQGYETMYVHGGYIEFSGKLPRFERWFETRFDRSNYPIMNMRVFNWGLTDRGLFDVSYAIIKSRRDPRPFYMTIATLSMHHPFGLPGSRFEAADHNDERNQLSNIARYSDDVMGQFIDRIMNDEELENTIIIVSGDHGINWFNPHKEREQNILWEDLVWVPMALIGKNWNLEPGINHETRQLADIGPTILDRLGIEVPNSFVGHSLLRRFDDDRPGRAFFATSNGGISAGMREGDYKYFRHFSSKEENLFDVAADREERHNLLEDEGNESSGDYYYNLVSNVYARNKELIASNRVWNSAFATED